MHDTQKFQWGIPIENFTRCEVNIIELVVGWQLQRILIILKVKLTDLCEGSYNNNNANNLQQLFYNTKTSYSLFSYSELDQAEHTVQKFKHVLWSKNIR